MRKIVDSNYLRSPNLTAFLSASRNNIAVLSDYASMEAYKGDALVGIQNSMAILSEYPSQVIILKNTLVVCGLSGRSAGLQKRLIDDEQTKGFSLYCRDLAKASAGDRMLQEKIIELGREAKHHIDERMFEDAKEVPESIELVARTYTKDEILTIQNNEIYTDDMIKKLLFSVTEISRVLFHRHPIATTIPALTELPNTFIFRTSLCLYLLAIDWIAIAGAKAAQDAKLTKIRNDLVDLNFAAYATYFDGLLSGDKKPLRIHSAARRILSRIPGSNLCKPH